MNVRKLLLAAMLVMAFQSCKDDDPAPLTRPYRMGFQNSAPRFDDFDMFIQSLTMWTERADAAIISLEVPWEALLGGTKASDYVVANYKDIVSYYRQKNLALWVYVDPQNGLNRGSDALALVAVGKSIADADVQAIYRQYVVAMDSVLQPEHLGLALETNLIRAASPAALYNGVKKAAADAAAAIRSRNTAVMLSRSVQAEQAWGKFTGSSFEGIDQDLADFPFVQELGISSYPYFVFNNPSDIPGDYYSRIMDGHSMPVFISEGGWTSAPVTTIVGNVSSSPETQRDYMQRQTELLNTVDAVAWFQLTFTDIDIDHLPGNIPDNIDNFAYLGLVDKNFVAKPALQAWDDIFHRTLKP